MKIALWIVFGLLAVLWTCGATAVTQLMQWSAQGLATGAEAPWSAIVTRGGVPAWLGAWIDPASWSAAQQAMAGLLADVASALPAIGSAIGWLVPAVWVVWAVGLVALIAVTLVVYGLISRFGPRHAPAPLLA